MIAKLSLTGKGVPNAQLGNEKKDIITRLENKLSPNLLHF